MAARWRNGKRLVRLDYLLFEVVLTAPGAPSATALSEEVGVPQATLSKWVREAGRVDFGLSNSTDITVSPAILAAGWYPSDLRTAVRQSWLSTMRS